MNDFINHLYLMENYRFEPDYKIVQGQVCCEAGNHAYSHTVSFKRIGPFLVATIACFLHKMVSDFYSFANCANAALAPSWSSCGVRSFM